MQGCKTWRRLSAALGAVLVATFAAVSLAADNDFLPVDDVFALRAQSTAQGVELSWAIAQGYYVYKERISIEQASPSNQALNPATWPEPDRKFDKNFNQDMLIYKHALNLPVPLAANTTGWLAVSYQGCAEAGLCYPPETRYIQLVAGSSAQLDIRSELPASVAPAEKQVIPSTAAVKYSDTATDSIASVLASGHWLRTVGMFWLAGLLLSFTPCVLPMVPILSSLIAGQQPKDAPMSRSKGFVLALAYSLGMSIVYAGFGVAAGLAGEGLAAALQNPWVLGTFALLLAILALSMFDVYELQMPSGIQSSATEWANRLPGGAYLPVFLMGALSALVVGPCVAAPLAGALVYISQTRDVWLGGSALFAMALGMSVPLLLVGASAGALLPRAGAWMERVKQVFGMLLLAVSVWMVSPVLSVPVQLLLWALWLMLAAVLLGVRRAAAAAAGFGSACAQALGLIAALAAIVMFMGAASGSKSLLQPLAHWGAGSSSGATAAAAHTGLNFKRIASSQELDTQIAQARQSGRSVMLDFYADWCVACKEFESYTFTDARVQKRLANTVLLQADVTRNTAQDKALMKRFSLFGPPAIILYSAQAAGGTEPSGKVVGYENAEKFLASLERSLR